MKAANIHECAEDCIEKLLLLSSHQDMYYHSKIRIARPIVRSSDLLQHPNLV